MIGLVRRWYPFVAIVLVGALISGCPRAGGAYEPTEPGASDVDRGETQGRMFDFVANRPDGDDWQIRIRGSSMWVSYASEDQVEDLGTKNLDRKETRKVWDLIDQLELADRKRGTKDADAGYVQLRLREPGGDDGHDIIQVYVSRATEDDDVLALAEYLIDLIAKYHPKYRTATALF
jgi:hypothetical protein